MNANGKTFRNQPSAPAARLGSVGRVYGDDLDTSFFRFVFKHLPQQWKEIKRRFTMRYQREVGPVELQNASRQNKLEAAIWQRRYGEQTLKDEEDLKTHLDYILYNPIKHGYVI